ncbi:MAG: acetoin utilization protein AcuC [Gammaproteobacteria bacterium]|nr:acetoin utilization protein AcuC [Gammaproteobacteria bacterium]MBT8133456.1 acetoin utilization protein AcuC [Gammaproteobacteria bacterium]NNJ50029.1 acetoin utilization protein AcuC [Gammaproteobacteria bacterium]
MTSHSCCVYLGDKLAAYGFGNDHPFGPQRHHVFERALREQALDKKTDILTPVTTGRETLELFHTAEYIDKVIEQSKFGVGYLDNGDTPAFSGMYEAVRHVAGSVADAIDQLMNGYYKHAFVPIAGLHHARRDTAAGFCVVNDCGIAIEILLNRYELKRVAYVDIDAHHGDGVFYSFEDDPRLIFADMHEDGRFLYPGTGAITETGKGPAAGTKLNIPMPPRSNDELFFKMWSHVESFLEKHQPQFILFQCGADSIAADPITDMEYSEKAHTHAAKSLSEIAERYCGGKLLAMGGGGYNHDNIAKAWTAVLDTLTD